MQPTSYFPSLNKKFYGFVTFTPARKTSQRKLPRRRFMMCTPMRFPSVSTNNCQLNHMALAHKKLTPALTSSCPHPLPHVHMSMIDTQQSHQHEIQDFSRTSGIPYDPRAHLCHCAANGRKGVCVFSWYMHGMSAALRLTKSQALPSDIE